MATSPPTRTEAVYALLRSELLNGILCPGEKLRMVELADRLGVSQSVVREALTRLAEQQLIVASPQRGFRVRELSVEDIAELTETRVQVETAALRLAIERGDVNWETGILSAHHVLERTPITEDDDTVSEQWALHHRDFHRALLAGCNNTRLVAIAHNLRDSAELYRRWYWVMADHHQRDVVAEHRQLKDLALARDADAVVKVLNEHIERAPRELIAFAREHGVGQLDR